MNERGVGAGCISGFLCYTALDLMAATAQSHLERAELEVVLQSGIFHRAPNLESFLRYICDRYFEGDADQIKEYSIAVEALGRRSDFDQKRDSIVRVEAHRLRKRLSDYYAGEGSDHAVHIVIPNGGYAPQFTYIYKDTDFSRELPSDSPKELLEDGKLLLLQEDPAHLETVEVPADESRPRSQLKPQTEGSGGVWTKSFIVLLAVFFVALLGLAGWALKHSNSLFANENWKGLALPVPSDYRFLAGYHGPAFVDRQGRTWHPDAYYTGGQSHPMPSGRFFEAVPDPAFLHSFRDGTFQYDIPVRPGNYEVHLYFVETQFGGNPREPDSGRLFQILLNDVRFMDLFDIISEAGAQNRLHERILKDVAPAKDGKIHLKFQGISGPGLLNAAEVLSSAPGVTRPVRIVASDTSVVDADGQIWTAEQYCVGGRLVKRTDTLVDSPMRDLYRAERYGNFAYHIPLAPGKYRVRLFFAETYFGTKLPFAPTEPVGARVFNVFANGIALLRDFDIAKEAHGSKRGIEKAFENLEPNAQGKIVLEFVPVRNYAEVNAIEVTQMP
jgi:Malectin domain